METAAAEAPVQQDASEESPRLPGEPGSQRSAGLSLSEPGEPGTHRSAGFSLAEPGLKSATPGERVQRADYAGMEAPSMRSAEIESVGAGREARAAAGSHDLYRNVAAGREAASARASPDALSGPYSVPGRRKAPAKAEERLFGSDATRLPGPGPDISEADAANLDFGSLQALISQQMASIEAEWEPDMGGRPPSSDFLRDLDTADPRDLPAPLREPSPSRAPRPERQ